MSTRSVSNITFIVLCLGLLFSTSGCSSFFVQAAVDEPAVEPVTYERFSLPEPDGISFELPEEWAFWANAGYLSPDDGNTLAGIRASWIQDGIDSEAYLFNEDSIVHEVSEQMVGGLAARRYIVESTLTSAATGEVIWHAYEMIYAFPHPDGKMMIGVVLSAQTMDELPALKPVAEHMLSSIKWASQAE